MRSAFLRGREHHRVGGVELVSEEPAAIALSRGGALKTYSHTDPNEDCVAFASGAGGYVLVAADGHHGALGSEAGVEAILGEFATSWTAAEAPIRPGSHSNEAWKREGVRALMCANRAILEVAAQSALPPAPTTFVVALIRPQDDLLLHLSVGDSHLFAVDRGVALDLGGRRPDWQFTPFLGYEEAREELLDKYALIGTRGLHDLRALVLATDGISEPGIGVANPAETVFGAVSQVELDSPPERRATDLCRSVTETALGAQRKQRAGDNMACSVLWLGA